MDFNIKAAQLTQRIDVVDTKAMINSGEVEINPHLIVAAVEGGEVRGLTKF